MSDFGVGTCDFHSDYASDFGADTCDFASDFRDYASDFGGAPRTAKHPPETPETAPPEQAAPRQSNRGTRAAASAPRKRQATEQGTTPRHKAINKGHGASRTAAV